MDVRVIAATHRNLPADIADNKFRSDLFYRLNVYPIEVPVPCGIDAEDIAALADFFIERHSSFTGKSVRRVDPESIKLLKTYSWPGNIRELQNVIERSMIMCESETLVIDKSFLSPSAAIPQAKTQVLNSALLFQEKEMIEHALGEKQRSRFGALGSGCKTGASALHFGVEDFESQDR